MDPMTMMAIANFGMQMMNGNKQQQPAASQPVPQQPAKPAFTPGALPAMNTTDYGAMIKNMIPQQMPQQPMMGQPGMQAMAGRGAF